MLFNCNQNNIFALITSSILLLFSIDSTFAEKIIINSKTPKNIEVQGSGKSSIAAIDITQDESTPTGSCSGYVSRNANHTLVLNTFINTLQISITSDRDTTLIIQGPGGIWCNDDYNGKNPQIVGQWQSGTYNIWIGSYVRNESYTYQLEINSQ